MKARIADNVGEQLLAELVGEVRLLRLAMQGEVAGDPPPTDETYLLLSQLAKFAPAGRSTLEKWIHLEDDPMPALRRPGDDAWMIQWGVFKKWLAARTAVTEGDDTRRTAEAVVVSMLRGKGE